MWVWLLVIILVMVAAVPWIRWPVKRVIPTDPVGLVLETNVFGFFLYTRNMSDKANKLQSRVRKLEEELKLNKKLLEDEQSRIDREAVLINDGYRAFLREWAGKRHWTFLYRHVPVPRDSFLNPPKPSKPSSTERMTRFSLDDLPPQFLKDEKGNRIRHFVFTADGPRNRGQQNQQQNNQRKKGGNQNTQDSNKG